MTHLPHPRKRFGQNFLHDQNMIRKIVSLINPQKNDRMIEIGPGHGALTRCLLEHLGHLTVIEIDNDLVSLLKADPAFKALNIIHQDVLNTNFKAYSTHVHDLRIIGNLPYNISTPLLFHLLSYRDTIHDMTFMLQKEVAERIAADCNTRAYGRLSVVLQYHCKIDYLLTVPPQVFFPQPKVHSAIIRLQPYRDNPWGPIDADLLEKTVQCGFAHRRKTLLNNFKGQLTANDFLDCQINPSARAETLTIPEWMMLVRHIN